MRGSKGILLVISIMLTLLLPVTAFAADNLYRLMHNDQQALVIAEVVESNSKSVEFKVEKSIVSERNLKITSEKKQLEIENFTIAREELAPIKFYENIETDDSYKQGDTYLISLNEKEKEEGYEIAWGVYELTSADYETLDISHPENSPEWRIMEAMAIKEFINTNGQESEFTFDGDNKILRSGDRVVYDGKSPKTEEVKKDEEIIDDEEIEDSPQEHIEKPGEKKEPIEKKENKTYENVIYVILGIGILIFLFKGKVGS